MIDPVISESSKNTQHPLEVGTILLIDKPAGWTSFDVVNKIRGSIKHHLGLKKIKVGHSGTLDPMATGLLLLGTGKCTRDLASLQELGKCYEGTITLGATTPTYDAESEPDELFPFQHITKEALEAAVTLFQGNKCRFLLFSQLSKWAGNRSTRKQGKEKYLNLKLAELLCIP